MERCGSVHMCGACVYTMEYISTLRKKELLTFAKPWWTQWHYTKWNKPGVEQQTPQHTTYTSNLKNKHRDWGTGEWGKWGDAGHLVFCFTKIKEGQLRANEIGECKAPNKAIYVLYQLQVLIIITGSIYWPCYVPSFKHFACINSLYPHTSKNILTF